MNNNVKLSHLGLIAGCGLAMFYSARKELIGMVHSQLPQVGENCCVEQLP